MWKRKFQPVEYNVEEKTEYNHERATKLIEGFDQMKEENMVKPENAYMVLKDEGFSIVPEVEGNAVNTEPVTAAILAALDEDAASVNVEEIEGAYKATLEPISLISCPKGTRRCG